ncbi:hypothetical protein BO71DRAFT_58685 [Aspergillus ellipticus CBS 707.79]|uniref:Secreted protein n=1 Tax=Aspergillus ellipticus CBS 707.79 TaxID=1448320 RepID=A0A319DLD6_9EURO|nr:hypothetical protein BO71DRAFT_58685 [Aspergillus ellipticus CBS 707.79]
MLLALFPMLSGLCSSCLHPLHPSDARWIYEHINNNTIVHTTARDRYSGVYYNVKPSKALAVIESVLQAHGSVANTTEI